MIYHIISAIGMNLELGKNNDLIWKNKADLQHFKETTMNKPMVMGYNTLESLPAVLKGREHFVLIDEKSLKDNYDHIVSKYYDKPVYFYHSIENVDEALKLRHHQEVMVVGGASIYRQYIDKVDKMTLTMFNDTCEDADVYFPSTDLWVCNKVIDTKELGDGVKVITLVKGEK